MSVSIDSTDTAGIVLLGKVWQQVEIAGNCLDHAKTPTGEKKHAMRRCGLTVHELLNMKEILVFAAHRLAFLEMVTKGLAYMEQHDAQAYAKFVEKKRKIEDMDIDELRVLLR